MSGKYSVSDFDSVIDVPNMSVIPGLIDAHTHPVWDGDRVHEFGMKVWESSQMSFNAFLKIDKHQETKAFDFLKVFFNCLGLNLVKLLGANV